MVWEDNSKPLSVAGLTAEEVFSELPDEMGEGASIKVTPSTEEKQQQQVSETVTPPLPHPYYMLKQQQIIALTWIMLHHK